jgi:hypothetical protein
MNRVHLGAADPNCAAGMPFDLTGNPCINECSKGMPFDSNGNPCPGSTDYSVYDVQYGGAGGGAPAYEQAAAIQAGNVAAPAVTKFPVTIALPPGPSPRVAVPLSTSIPGSIGLWFTNSSLIAGVPNWEVMIGAAVVASLLGGVFAGKRRR